ncbi:peptide-methionine (R)-S-oxide reductase, partial [Pseudomonas quasicaspiana]|nr:peptide-methionine (R)-S-oxide reductase [Pseudomonas quasicaspiana]
MEKLDKTLEEWRAMLDPEQYNVCRLKGTERPFSGKYNSTKTDGVY